MAIRSSSAKAVEALTANLSSASAVVRETAVARLAVIGARAVVSLSELVDRRGASSTARIAALHALESIADDRAIDVGKRALSDPDKSVAIAAAAMLRQFLTGKRGADVADVLTARALDQDATEAVRLAALVALEELGATALQPLWNTLRHDSNASVRLHVAEARVGHRGEITGDEPAGLADDPYKLTRELATGGRALSLVDLQHLIERIRTREESESGAQHEAWVRARGAAHVALAKRGSRVAFYDLRESLEQALAPLPVEFMTALALAGDLTCLDSIAAAHSHAVGTDNEWWRSHLADAFHAIVAREKLTRRHAVIKRIQKRWPAILNTTSQT